MHTSELRDLRLAAKFARGSRWDVVWDKIAQKTGGHYFRATDTADLQRIYDRIDALEKSQIEITHYSQEIELIGWVLLPALMLILAEQFLSHTLFRRIP